MNDKIRVMTQQTATLQIPKNITKGEELKMEVIVDEQSTIHSVLQQVEDKELLAKLFDERGNPSNYLTVMLNGKNIAFRDGIDTVVKGSDQVYVLPVVSGGSL